MAFAKHLEKEVSAEIANYQWLANCNDAAEPFTDPEILEEPSLYPPQEVLDRCEYFATELGSETENKINEIWVELIA